MNKVVRSATNNAPLLYEAAVAVCFPQEPHKTGGSTMGMFRKVYSTPDCEGL
ncbi:hypothetical protein NKW53_02245 [Acetobacter orientalis]|uniref:hypothetical protein n=1 Tax=Acetobacter orientalis TaxID=146474 RepID=UPI00209E617C|nr:hypothetical protein [Acetobacter orientalis]MCP1214893.1 hypothetical protein [Acetobacter orientalis]MCP1218476.1 hypothetical protein [Acetobacter orientalis]